MLPARGVKEQRDQEAKTILKWRYAILEVKIRGSNFD